MSKPKMIEIREAATGVTERRYRLKSYAIAAVELTATGLATWAANKYDPSGNLAIYVFAGGLIGTGATAGALEIRRAYLTVRHMIRKP